MHAEESEPSRFVMIHDVAIYKLFDIGVHEYPIPYIDLAGNFRGAKIN